ncbi:MAG: methyltransferase [Flavobacteriaceae bacterium]|nr:methyltransferase [Flavobacteriaceae bacterium]
MSQKHSLNRYQKTIDFLVDVLPPPAVILDLGVRNPFSEVMESKGYTVINTHGEDLDLMPDLVNNHQVDAVTGFEILEHLVSPYPILKEIKAKKLIVSVPLNLWFAKAYRSKTDMRDRHYHEFEDWQFDWLLEKSGWNIQKREKWTSPTNQIGIRPLLRKFTPRFYVIFATKP